MADGLTVGAVDQDTGDQVMEQDPATGKYKAKNLSGIPAIEQNIVNQNMMQERQGYRGTLRGDPTRGNPWKGIDPEPGLIGSKMHPRTVAMVIGLETRRVPGVNTVPDVDIKTPTQEERVNREVTPQIKALVGTEDFPVETKFTISG